MSSASFVVVCALVGSIFATPPLPRPSNDAGVVSLSRANPGAFINAYSNSNEKQNIWFYEFQLKVAKLMVGSIEYLSMADGSHLLVPLSENTDSEREYKTVSIALSKLITNLTSMERTNKLIMNVNEELLETKSQYTNDTESLRSALKTFLHSYIESIDKKFGTDEELAAEYKKQKSTAKQFVERDPKMQDALFEVKDDFITKIQNGMRNEKIKILISIFLQSKDTLCEGLANQAFVGFLKTGGGETFSSTVHKRYLMARALIRKAQSSGYESKVNQVYHNALVQARPHVVADYANDSYILEMLFPLIEKELASNPTLQKEIVVLMKQIEDNHGHIKGYVRTKRSHDDGCVRKIVCEASKECADEQPSSGIYCQLGTYATSTILQKTTSTPYESLQEAGRRGRTARSTDECKQVYTCNE